MIHVRCSMLPILERCPAAAIAPALRIEEGDRAPAKLGSAVHRYLAGLIEANRDAPYAQLADAYGVDVEDLAPLCAMARRAWLQVADAFPEPESEAELFPLVAHGVQLSGTADVVSLDDSNRTAAILDAKSGWGDGDHESQVKGYALLACAEGGYDRARGTVLSIRHGTVETWEWTVAELLEWWDALAKRIAAAVASPVYAPSAETCRYCWRRLECDARQQLVRTSSAILTEGLITHPLTADDMVDLVARARLVKAAAEQVLDMVDSEVEQRGGTVTAADGRTLTRVETTRTEIVPEPAWGILTEALGPRLVEEAVSISKSRAVKIVRDQAGRGSKQLAESAMLAELEAAGALREKVITRLELARAPKAITQEAAS